MTDSTPIRLSYTMDPGLTAEAGRALQARVLAAGPRWLAWGPPAVFALGCGAVGAVILPEIALWTGEMIAFGLGMLVAFAIMSVERYRMARSALAQRLQSVLAEGEIRSDLGPDGWRFDTAASSGHVTWRAIPEVLDLSRGIALVAGAAAHPIPDSALPQGMTRADLRSRIARWREHGA